MTAAGMHQTRLARPVAEQDQVFPQHSNRPRGGGGLPDGGDRVPVATEELARRCAGLDLDEIVVPGRGGHSVGGPLVDVAHLGSLVTRSFSQRRAWASITCAMHAETRRAVGRSRNSLGPWAFDSGPSTPVITN